MNCPHARDLFPELLDRRIPEAAHAEARTHLASCPECQREFAALAETARALDTLPAPQPTPNLRRNVYAMLEAELHSAPRAGTAAGRERRARRATLARWVLSSLAGCALLALGFYAGLRHAPTATPTLMQPAVSTVAMQSEIKKLQDQVNKMGQLVGYSLLQQQQSPTNDRLRDVLAAAGAETPSDRVLDDLISAVALDPSANVRLRALEALFPHAERDVVRAGVLAALPREQNPLVQLELIDFVAVAHDREATPALEKISQNTLMDQSVRDAAKRALAQF